MNKTTIEWCDFTFNPITGCENSCPYCYARRLANERLRHMYLANPNVAPGCDLANPFAPRFWPDRLGDPAKRKKPSKIFICSMGELFGPWVPSRWIHSVMRVVQDCPQHTFQVLTKYPERMAAMFRDANPDDYQNLWLGVSVENQEGADSRIPWLLTAGTRYKFLSCEPLTGPLRLNEYLLREQLFGLQDDITWLILGAMTGPNAVKPQPEWISDLVTLADYAGVPAFMKDNIRPFVPEGYWRREWPVTTTTA